MKRKIKLTESDLIRVIKKVIINERKKRKPKIEDDKFTMWCKEHGWEDGIGEGCVDDALDSKDVQMRSWAIGFILGMKEGKLPQKVIKEEEEGVQKITQEEYDKLKAAAQKFLDDKFINKTVNLYTHDYEDYKGHGSEAEEYEDMAMGPWKISAFDFQTAGLYSFYPENGHRMEVLISFEAIEESEKETRRYHRPIEKSRRRGYIETNWNCGKYEGKRVGGDDYFWNQDNLKGEKSEVISFTNGPLIKALNLVCNAENAFTAFNDLFEDKWKLIKDADFGMGDEDIDLDVDDARV